MLHNATFNTTITQKPEKAQQEDHNMKNNKLTKEQIWKNLEHLTQLTIQKELTLEEAELCAFALFKLSEKIK